MNLYTARVSALIRLIGKEQVKDFAQRYHLNASYISQILNGHRELGEKAALSLEEKIGLPLLSLCYPQEIRVAVGAEAQQQRSPETVDQVSLSMSWARLNSAISMLLSATPAQMGRAASILEMARDEFAEKLRGDAGEVSKP